MPVLAWKIDRHYHDPVLLQQELPASVRGLDDTSRLLPGGAYTTFRTYNRTRALHLTAHLNRLEETAALAGIPVRLEHAPLRKALANGIEIFPAEGELRMRLILDLEQIPGDLYLSVETLAVPPDAAYLHGVQVITCDLQRALPRAKLTRFIAKADPLRKGLPAGVNEAVMVNKDGLLLEGLSSNFFAVLDGEIWTAGEGVLEGITRTLVIEAAQKSGVSLHLQSPSVNDLQRFQEAFITSSGRGLLPVCKIDDAQIGSGSPGQITQRLMVLFSERILADLEPIG
jgi:branched-chain amino acid aminotransferase